MTEPKPSCGRFDCGFCDVCDPDGGKLERIIHLKRWAEEYHKWLRRDNLITLREFDHD